MKNTIIKCLKDSNSYIRNGVCNKQINLGEKEVLEAARLISNDILKNYDLENDKIGLLGVARSGLPLLTIVSHYCNQRKVSVMQVQTTASDKIRDFAKETTYLGEMIQNDVDKFIILEDVVCYGHCSNEVINRLKKLGKETVAVYTIVMNEKFENCEYDDPNVILKYVNKTSKDQWIHYFWDKEYQEGSEF